MHSQILSEDLSNQLYAFGASVEGTSLYLLRAIKSTVDSLEANERLAEATALIASMLAKNLASETPVVGHLLDPDDKVINGIESAYRALEDGLPRMLLCKESIDKDADLNGEHCELLHTAYDRNIAALANLIESAKNLRAAIISHDLAAEPRGQQSFESAGMLIHDLRAV
jgi:hypothetical protein